MYAEQIIDHFLRPRNVGVLESPDGCGRIGDPACGDSVEIGFKTDGTTVLDVKYRVFGCPAAIATTSIFSEFIKGKSLSQAREISEIEVSQAAGGLSEEKSHCSILAIAAFREALLDYMSKNGQDHKI